MVVRGAQAYQLVDFANWLPLGCRVWQTNSAMKGVEPLGQLMYEDRRYDADTTNLARVNLVVHELCWHREGLLEVGNQ